MHTQKAGFRWHGNCLLLVPAHHQSLHDAQIWRHDIDHHGGQTCAERDLEITAHGNSTPSKRAGLSVRFMGGGAWNSPAGNVTVICQSPGSTSLMRGLGSCTPAL